MPFNYDDVGVEKRGGPSIPPGDYPAVITSATPGLTKNGDDKVTVTYEIIDGPHKGKTLKNHNVTFFKTRSAKGAGFALDFLKSIGEPWQGQFEVDEKRWINKYVMAHVVHKPGSDGKGLFVNVAWVNEYKAEHDPFPTVAAKQEEESVPF